jgi:hypothetical protein
MRSPQSKRREKSNPFLQLTSQERNLSFDGLTDQRDNKKGERKLDRTSWCVATIQAAFRVRLARIGRCEAEFQ